MLLNIIVQFNFILKNIVQKLPSLPTVQYIFAYIKNFEALDSSHL